MCVRSMYYMCPRPAADPSGDITPTHLARAYSGLRGNCLVVTRPMPVAADRRPLGGTWEPSAAVADLLNGSRASWETDEKPMRNQWRKPKCAMNSTLRLAQVSGRFGLTWVPLMRRKLTRVGCGPTGVQGCQGEGVCPASRHGISSKASSGEAAVQQPRGFVWVAGALGGDEGRRGQARAGLGEGTATREKRGLGERGCDWAGGEHRSVVSEPRRVIKAPRSIARRREAPRWRKRPECRVSQLLCDLHVSASVRRRRRRRG